MQSISATPRIVRSNSVQPSAAVCSAGLRRAVDGAKMASSTDPTIMLPSVNRTPKVSRSNACGPASLPFAVTGRMRTRDRPNGLISDVRAVGSISTAR